MSYAQQQIIDMAPELNEADANFVASLMSRIIVFNGNRKEAKPTVSEKRQAYLRLKKAVGGFPADFDPEKEIAEARETKYGTLD